MVAHESARQIAEIAACRADILVELIQVFGRQRVHIHALDRIIDGDAALVDTAVEHIPHAPDRIGKQTVILLAHQMRAVKSADLIDAHGILHGNRSEFCIHIVRFHRVECSGNFAHHLALAAEMRRRRGEFRRRCAPVPRRRRVRRQQVDAGHLHVGEVAHNVSVENRMHIDILFQQEMPRKAHVVLSAPFAELTGIVGRHQLTERLVVVPAEPLCRVARPLIQIGEIIFGGIAAQRSKLFDDIAAVICGRQERNIRIDRIFHRRGSRRAVHISTQHRRFVGEKRLDTVAEILAQPLLILLVRNADKFLHRLRLEHVDIAAELRPVVYSVRTFVKVLIILHRNHSVRIRRPLQRIVADILHQVDARVQIHVIDARARKGFGKGYTVPVRGADLHRFPRRYDLDIVDQPLRLPFGMVAQNQPARGAAGIVQFVVQPNAQAEFVNRILYIFYEGIPHFLAFQIVYQKRYIGCDTAVPVFFEHVQRRFIHAIGFIFARMNDRQRAEPQLRV